ncbi:MAG: DUF1549 and DUF1553 domain-containing protein [Planctomycetia bacterium]|nr:DUF1549 and DUF1553 domain-containing protein [Planctomycetia bacterium]
MHSIDRLLSIHLKLRAASPAVRAVASLLLVLAAASLSGVSTARAVLPSELSTSPPALTFELDIMPILTSTGCTTGPCHGKARGQNGFQLSLLGFDAEFDYNSIVKHARGRRVNPSAPEQSLLLRKAAGQVPHGGGVRVPSDSKNFETIRRWIAQGLPRSGPTDPTLVGIDVAPRERILPAKAREQLRVTARYSDGSQRDVTDRTAYQSNDAAVAAIDAAGSVVAGALPGETAIMARYMNHIAVFNVAVPLAGAVDKQSYAALPRRNFIDELVWKRLETLGIIPSAGCDDAAFLRRASLDVIGRLPTSAEVRTFLADKATDKRARLVDALLERPEYGDHWANKWVDLLRPNPYRVGVKATFAFDAWIRDAFRVNKPYDRFVYELLTARGSTFRNGATVLFRDRREPAEVTTIACQLFLGVRLDCARCHHHPFEVWGQDDFYGTAAYFTRVGYKGLGLSPPISGGEEFVITALKGSIAHPLTGLDVTPKPLTGTAPIVGDEDPRAAFARWVVAPENRFFEQVAVNRIWADLMGRGIVDPVDDLRATNPPTNPELLAALGREFRRLKFDQKQFLRVILNSHAYELSSLPNPRNAWDQKNYSRHYRQRLRAETLLDAVCDVTGMRENFSAMPPNSRAVEIWTHRVENLFLDSFGRPDPNQDPPCERTSDSTMVQSLHLMNAPALHKKVIDDQGRLAALVKASKSPEELVDELYLSTYSRFPTAEERLAATKLFPADRAKHREIAEDLLWALLNTPEFTFKN